MYYGDYYRGDYYRGDPGLFGWLGKTVGKVGKAALGIGGAVLPGPLGGAARLGQRLLGGTRDVAPPPPTIVPPAMDAPALPPVSAFRPGSIDVAGKTQRTLAARKRRRMNYGNVKALKRADRRIDGFVKTARSALKHTNYKVVSKSAGSRGGGSRGVITRREASRALSR